MSDTLQKARVRQWAIVIFHNERIIVPLNKGALGFIILEV